MLILHSSSLGGVKYFIDFFTCPGVRHSTGQEVSLDIKLTVLPTTVLMSFTVQLATTLMEYLGLLSMDVTKPMY